MVTQATLEREIESGENSQRLIRRLLRSIRRWIDRHPRLRFAYRLGVGVLGGIISIVGLLLVPLPGPGWLIVFLGLAILGTEFTWAKRLAAFTKRQLARFWAWWKRRRADRAARDAH